MKLFVCYFLLSLNCAAQILEMGQDPFHFGTISLPVYYFPFYDGVQIIEVDYYSESLDQGALQDAMYPRGGSSYYDAMMMNKQNGYLVRNQLGEIIANYGVMNLQKLKLNSPDSCKIITHQQRLNSVRNQGHHSYANTIKELNGYGYGISRMYTPVQRTEMPEMSVQLFGVLDTLGNIVIPMNHHRINYANGEYLVERDTRLYNQLEIRPISKKDKRKKKEVPFKRYAIYDSTFQLTLRGSDILLKRISKNCYSGTMEGSVYFMDRFGNPLHLKNYQSIRDASYSGLIIYTVYKNDTLFQGLLSRQLEEVTPAIFSSIVSFKNGFIVRNRHQHNGYLNLQGKQIVPFELEAVTIDYRRDSFIVFKRYVDVANGKMLCSGLMDTNGKVLLPPEYWNIDNFNTEITRVKKDNKFGFINRSGEVLCPVIYSGIGQMNRNFIEVTIVNKGVKRGLVDRLGKVIVEPVYNYVKWIDSIIYFGNEQDEHFIYDFKSGEKYQHSFGFLIPQVNGLSFYMKGEKYGLVDAKGKLMIPAKFEKIRAYRSNRAVVQLNGKFGLIDERGKIVQAIKYEIYTYDENRDYVLK